jgi:hypothetical protein
MHPQINKKKFTKEEDQRLLALANEHKGHNWQSIAVALGVLTYAPLPVLSFGGRTHVLTFAYRHRPAAPRRSACNAISAA